MLGGRNEYAWVWIQVRILFFVALVDFYILDREKFEITPLFCLRDTYLAVTMCFLSTDALQNIARIEWVRISFELPAVRPSYATSHSPACMGDEMTRALSSTPASNCNNIVVHFATRFTDCFSRQFRGPAKLNMVRVVPKEPKAALKGAKS